VPVVGFDATSALTQGAGIGRYTRELLGAFSRRPDRDFTYQLFAAAGGKADRMPELDERFHLRTLPWSDRVLNIVWHRLRLPLPVQLATGGFDLFHSPDFTLPPVMRRPTVLTVHDLAFFRVPEFAYPTLRVYLQRVVPRSVRRATHVIAVSEATRRDVIEVLGIRPERVSVVHEGVSRRFHPPSDLDAARRTALRLGIAGPYILSVGTLEPRKNYVRLIEAFAGLRRAGIEHTLVLAGRPGWLNEPIFSAIDSLGLREHVRVVEPTDADLPALYGAADLFVYASLYEGFGIPPLEALACGTPTVSSNAASLPEVVGSAALLVAPEDVDGLRSAMLRVLDDPGLQAELRARGPEQSGQFTWERAAEATVEIYRRVLQ
jgi:glycosyltransferase involved in cell wall biosynthesis